MKSYRDMQKKEKMEKVHQVTRIGDWDDKSGRGTRYHEHSLMGSEVRRGKMERAKGIAIASIMQQRFDSPTNPIPKTNPKGKEVEKQEAGWKQHPGPSRSESQKIYDAKMQSKKEAHLKTPEGEAARVKGNAERLKDITKEGDGAGKKLGELMNKPIEKSKVKKEEMTPTPGPTLGSVIGFPGAPGVSKAELGSKEIKLDAKGKEPVNVEESIARPEKSLDMEEAKNEREKKVLETKGGHTPEFGKSLQPGMSYRDFFKREQGEPLKKPCKK